MTDIVEAPARAVVQPPVIPANSPMAMMLAARAQGASLEEIEKMMDLQERWQRREAEVAYNDALAAFKAEAVEIIKRKTVDFTSQKGRTHYKHAELSDVVEAVGPALSKHGFAWSWRPVQDGGTIRVTCILKHRQGHSDSVWLEAGADTSGNKNAIQAVSSTITYLQRQTLKAITGVSEKGDDDDARSGGGVSEEDQSIADDWRAALEGSADLESLTQIWADGLKEIRKLNRMDLYEAFRGAYQATKAKLEGAAQ